MHSFQHDQAAGLRKMMTGHQPKIFTILSGTSESSQPSLIANLAAAISQQDADVLILQTAKDEVSQYGIKALPALSEVIQNKRPIEQCVKNSQFGFMAAKLHKTQSSKTQLNDIADPALNKVFENLASLFEVVLVEARLDEQHQLPLEILNQHEILIQLSCNASSIKEAYTLIKRVYSQMGRRKFGIIVSDANDKEAATVFRNIAKVSSDYMQIELEFLGAIPSDKQLSRATQLGRVINDAFPLAKATIAFKALAQRLHFKHQHSVETELATFI
jgi:flagellar biosynthesis protein FlhG